MTYDSELPTNKDKWIGIGVHIGGGHVGKSGEDSQKFLANYERPITQSK